MSFFGKLFKKEPEVKAPRGFHTLTVKQINRLSKNAVELVFDVPAELKTHYHYEPGQYVNIAPTINGKEERRSYSICSDRNAHLSIAIKEVENGIVSTWANQTLQVGDAIFVSKPEGNFTLNGARNIVGIAAGSGVTPLISMAYEIEQTSNASMQLFYANKTETDILFKDTLGHFTKTTNHFYLTQETKEGYFSGRITKDSFMQVIKNNLDLLKSDGFYICGPEEMVMSVKSALELFGVNDHKIHFELFTPATNKVANPVVTDFVGKSNVKVIIDDEVHQFVMEGSKQTVLDAANQHNADAPYSCKGGVCSTCRAKVIKGSASMTVNYTLTDKEIEQGFILTCQAHPTSEELIISFDE